MKNSNNYFSQLERVAIKTGTLKCGCLFIYLVYEGYYRNSNPIAIRSKIFSFSMLKCVIQQCAGCYGKNLSGIYMPHKGWTWLPLYSTREFWKKRNNSFPFFVRANCEGRKKIIFCITRLSLSKENDLVKFMDSEHYLSHPVCVVCHH